MYVPVCAVFLILLSKPIVIMNARTVQVKHTCPLCVAPVRNIARSTAERESAPMRGAGAERPSVAAAQIPTREPPPLPSLSQRAEELQQGPWRGP